MEQDHYTITYRAAEARQMMDWIKAGQSGCVIGLRGAGKSNFLRFILREETHRHYFGQTCADFLFVLIDLLSLIEQTDWAMYELILDRLSSQLSLLEIDASVVEQIAFLHQEVAYSEKPLVARRAVEQCVDALCQQPARQVILILDEFDTVFRDHDPSLFRCLWAIRDALKDRVSYIIATTTDLGGLRDDVSEVEHFCRLVGRNVCYLGSYAEADACHVIQYLASRRSIELGMVDVDRLLAFSGGHAGLIKTVLGLLGSEPKCSLADLVPTLANKPEVQAECRKVWGGLAEAEQLALYTLAREGRVDAGTLEHLERRGLAKSEPKPTIFASLFTDFVRRQGPPPVQGTVVRRSPRLVQIDGRRIEDLGEQEFELLRALYEHRGQVCTKDDLIKAVYFRQYHEIGTSLVDARLHTLITHLRYRTEMDPSDSCYVLTVRWKAIRHRRVSLVQRCYTGNEVGRFRRGVVAFDKPRRRPPQNITGEVSMSKQFEHGYALLIGVNENQVEKWALPYVTQDVARLEQVLLHPERCAYPRRHVKTITGQAATRTGIMDGLDWLQEHIEKDEDSTAVAYYSGHGWRDDGKQPPEFYFVPYDVKKNKIAERGLRAGDFASAVGKMRSRRLVAILDCCYAGGMGVKGVEAEADEEAFSSPGAGLEMVDPAWFMDVIEGSMSASLDGKGIEELGQGWGRAVLCSSSAQRKSYPHGDGTMSLFTYHLIAALNGEEAEPGESTVTALRVMKYVAAKVPKERAVQTPVYRFEGSDFPVALLLGGKGLTPGAKSPDPMEALPGSTVAQGERSVAVGGDIQSSTIITGDGNVVGNHSSSQVVKTTVNGGVSGGTVVTAGGDVQIGETEKKSRKKT